jgi:PAS domain S-box-containing protein
VLGRLDTLDAVNLTNLVQRLARERALFEEIFNTLQEGVLVVDDGGAIEYANHAAQRIIGVGGSGGLTGQTLWRLIPGLRSSLGAALDDVDGAGAAPVVAREFELTYPDPRNVRLYMVPFRLAGSGERRYAVILTDVTKDKQTTEARIENERTSSILLLAAGVAHELGNPLNSLTIHLQLIERKLKKLKAGNEAAALSESVAICRDEVARLDGIISHFLEAIRPRAPDLVETDLADVLAEVLRFQQKELENRGISVEAETAALPVVLADRNQLKQVFSTSPRMRWRQCSPAGSCASGRGPTTIRFICSLLTPGAASSRRTCCACSNPTIQPSPAGTA